MAESEKLSIRANAATRVRMCVGFKLTKERYEDFLGSNIAMSDRFCSLRNRSSCWSFRNLFRESQSAHC